MAMLVSFCVCTLLINLAASLPLASISVPDTAKAIGDGPKRGRGGGLRLPRVVARTTAKGNGLGRGGGARKRKSLPLRLRRKRLRTAAPWPDPEVGENRKVKLFIAIGTNPAYGEHRLTLRETWMRWVREAEPGLVELRFFTEETTESIRERDAHGDIVFQDVPGGYQNYMARFHFQTTWIADRYDFDYLLRLDDDGFLCVPRVLEDLRRVPKEKFFWGKYFCRDGKMMADENFMLFSRDVVDFFLETWDMFRVDTTATFAAHFGMWQHFLDLDVLDDRARIDAQQGYLTSWMRTDANAPSVDASPEDYENFCADYVWAHHVKNPLVFRNVFAHTDWNVLSNMRTRAENPMNIGPICDGEGANPADLFIPSINWLGVDGKAPFPTLKINERYNFERALRQQD